MVSKNNEELKLDNIKLTTMKFRVLQLEKINVKTKQKKNTEMVNAIRKIISDEINKNI